MRRYGSYKKAGMRFARQCARRGGGGINFSQSPETPTDISPIVLPFIIVLIVFCSAISLLLSS